MAAGSLRRRRWQGWLYLLPALIFYGLIMLKPAGQSVVYSLYRWDGVSAPTWVGAGNYLDFFTDETLRDSLGHIVVLMGFYAVLPIMLGLISAALLGRTKRRGHGFYRWVIFLPQVLTSVVVAVVWKQLYAPDGMVNKALTAAGLGALARNWLGDFTWALPALGMVGTWTTFGFCMLLFLSGTAAISTELFDAARVDGAGAIAEFFAITLPALRPQIAVALVMTITGSLRTFDMVWLMTKGGPGTSTMTPAVLLYTKAFAVGDVGAAAAIGVIMALVCLLVTVLILRVVEDRS